MLAATREREAHQHREHAQTLHRMPMRLRDSVTLGRWVGDAFSELIYSYHHTNTICEAKGKLDLLELDVGPSTSCFHSVVRQVTSLSLIMLTSRISFTCPVGCCEPDTIYQKRGGCIVNSDLESFIFCAKKKNNQACGQYRGLFSMKHGVSCTLTPLRKISPVV